MPPRCLEAVNCAGVPTDQSRVANSAYQIFCKMCGGGAFRLVEVFTGESTTGIDVECEACSHTANLFDGMHHGYDGELGHTAMFIEGEKTRVPAKWFDETPKRHDRVYVIFTYNNAPEENEETSKERGIAVIDLFDWFSVVEDNPNSGETMWEYECA